MFKRLRRNFTEGRSLGSTVLSQGEPKSRALHQPVVSPTSGEQRDRGWNHYDCCCNSTGELINRGIDDGIPEHV